MPENQFHLCPKFYQTFTVLGQKWNGLIIEALVCQHVLRFKELAQIIPKCSDRVLVQRLKELADVGILKRETDAQTKVVTYALTKKGQGLKPIMHDVHEWSDKWCHCHCN